MTKVCAVCGCPYVGASCPNCGSKEVEVGGITVAGGLRYETGRQMPPGMQEIYGVKLAGEMQIATPAEPVCNDEEIKQNIPLFEWPHESSVDKMRRVFMKGDFDDRPKMDPIISLVQAEWKTVLVGEVLKAVGEVGVDVNEERLLRALREAERFWEEGYLAGVGSDRGWIPVDKQCPDSKTKVMVFGGDQQLWIKGKLQTVPTQYTGYMRGPDEGWFRWDDHAYIPNVTHWRPMLDNPEGFDYETKENDQAADVAGD